VSYTGEEKYVGVAQSRLIGCEEAGIPQRSKSAEEVPPMLIDRNSPSGIADVSKEFAVPDRCTVKKRSEDANEKDVGSA
jgi:hypothetical protein